jgi:hypothetical protein
MRLPDPFSSNLKVSEAACVDAEVWMHGYGCVTTDYDPFSSNLKSVRLHVCIECGSVDAWVWMRHMRLLTHSHPTSRSVSACMCDAGV